jgi:glucoamylase
VPCIVRWSADQWCTASDAPARDTGLGEWATDLPTDHLPSGTRIDFTFYWTEVDRWEDLDFSTAIVEIK